MFKRYFTAIGAVMFTSLLAGVGVSEENAQRQGAKPSATERDDAERHYRLVVVQGVPGKKFAKHQKVVLETSVFLSKPFEVKKRGVTVVKGLLRKTKGGQLHFKGNVTVGSTFGQFDLPVKLDKDYAPDAFGFSSILFLFFVRFEEPIEAQLEDEKAGDVGRDETTTSEKKNAIEVSKKPAPADEGVIASQRTTWSKPVNDVSARLRVVYEQSGESSVQGILFIRIRHVPTIEFKNESKAPLAICNGFKVDAQVFDRTGKEMKGAPRPPDNATLFIGLKWASIPTAAYVGWPADSRCSLILSGGSQGIRSGEGVTFLEIGLKQWKLKPGVYSIQTRLVARTPTVSTINGDQPLKTPKNQWTGEIDLPRMTVVVTDRQVARLRG